MRQEINYNEQVADNLNASPSTNEPGAKQLPETAFEYLKSLPRNLHRPALESYRRGKESTIIDEMVAQDFTDSFRGASSSFSIPVSWSLTKSALLNLLGITSHQGYPEVNGVRFYAGLNGDNYLTLIAVSTTEGNNCNDDLTIADSYAYYDYADMCPSHCSNSGNLRVQNGPATAIQVAAI